MFSYDKSKVKAWLNNPASKWSGVVVVIVTVILWFVCS